MIKNLMINFKHFELYAHLHELKCNFVNKKMQLNEEKKSLLTFI